MRLFSRWEAQRRAEVPFHQLFVTASATLRQQVESNFRKLQNSIRPEGEEGGAEAAARGAFAAPLRSFLPGDIPEECEIARRMHPRIYRWRARLGSLIRSGLL